jgi:hypothetical protein
MSMAHSAVLYTCLVLLGLSLVGPGLSGTFRPGVGRIWLIADSAEAKNHLRGLNAMMTALGAIAFWACWDLESARLLVIALGLVMALLVIARLYSLMIDGPPGSTTLIYLSVEAALGAIFLLWPPPAI